MTTTMKGGNYRARATGEVVLGESREKHTPYVELYFVVTDGPSRGERVRWTGYFTDKTSERTIESLQHCGWKGDDLSEFSDHGLHGLDANEVEIVVEIESREWQGQTIESPRVKWINRLGGGKGRVNLEQSMSAGAAAAFGERMRGLVVKVKAGAKAAPAAPEAASANAAAIDELPF